MRLGHKWYLKYLGVNPNELGEGVIIVLFQTWMFTYYTHCSRLDSTAPFFSPRASFWVTSSLSLSLSYITATAALLQGSSTTTRNKRKSNQRGNKEKKSASEWRKWRAVKKKTTSHLSNLSLLNPRSKPSISPTLRRSFDSLHIIYYNSMFYTLTC